MLLTNNTARIVSGMKGQHLAQLALKSGKLVAFSTETVYGLGADATNDAAVASIFEAKNRPKFNPLIIHVESKKQALDNVEWTHSADLLADIFWPGPLTMVLPRRQASRVSFLASAGLDTLAIRVPVHKVAQKLLSGAPFPIAAPSANKSGRVSPTSASHVDAEFGSELTLILDGGQCKIGVESTVVDLTTDQPILLRPGGVSKENIEDILGPIKLPLNGSKISSPGMLERHYAPKATLRTNVAIAEKGEVLIGFGPKAPSNIVNLSKSGDLREAAANLFSTLRILDNGSNRKIGVMPIPRIGLGLAINDRLDRATNNRLE